jgi:hypothetical protein
MKRIVLTITCALLLVARLASADIVIIGGLGSGGGGGGGGGTPVPCGLNNQLQYNNGGICGGLTVGTGLVISGGALNIAATAVVPGNYTNTNLTVNQLGQITAAANGSSSGGGVSSVTASSPLSSSGGATPNITITSPLPIANGGTGSASPGETAGTGIVVAGSFPTKSISLIVPVAVANGGTGATSAGATAAHNIGAAAQGANSDITSLAGLTTPLTVAQGGTQCSSAGPFASLPGSPAQGTICTVTNSSSCTAGTACNGSGTSSCECVFLGSSWLPAGGAVSAATGGVTAVNASAPLASTGGATPTISLNSPLPVANGGTNATSAGATAAHNIGAAALGANSDITSLSGLTTALSVAQGGTQCPGELTYSTLPVTPAQGTTCIISDSNSGCVAGTPVTSGSGSTVCTVTYQGTSWNPGGGVTAPGSGGFNTAGTGLTAAGSTVSLVIPVTVARGGTGATSAGATAANNIGALAEASNLSDVASATTARTNLSAAKSGANSDITSLTGLTTPLSVAQGGTGAAAAGATAANNIGALAIASNLGDLASVTTARTNLGLGTFATQNFTTPPAIGGVTPAAGSFSSLTDTGVTGSTQCLQANSSGAVSGSGAGCGGTINAAVCNITGITTGTATVYEPIQGTNYKVALVYFNAYQNAGGPSQTCVYATGSGGGTPGTAFTNTPFFVGNSVPLSASTNTTFTFPDNMTGTYTGWAEIHGF